MLTASFGDQYSYQLGKRTAKFESNLVITHEQIDETNLFKCTCLSFFKSSTERFNSKFVTNLILLVTEESEIQQLNIIPLTQL